MMFRSFKIKLPLFVLLLSIIACGSGTSGSVIGSSQSCQWGTNVGACEGSFDKLSGTYSVDIENDDISTGDPIDVQVDITVGSGIVNVSVESPEGWKESVQAKPRFPGTLNGQAEGDFGTFEVTFEAVDGDAEDISWSITYQVR
jgi:hypothetical protein